MSAKIDIKESDEYKTYLELSEYGLVYPPRTCSNISCKKTGEIMAPYLQKRSKDAKNRLLYWRCGSCGRSKTAYDDSFFSLFKKTPPTIIGLIKCWASQLSVSNSVSMIQLKSEQKVCEDIVSTLFNRLRQACSISLDKENIQLGGVGKIVEIDETLYVPVKNSKGKSLSKKQIWLIGLVERNDLNNKSYFTIVPDREASTLLNIICSKCVPGTIIYSDSWDTYNKINNLTSNNDYTVNHSLNFIDPETGTCTNEIQNIWRSCKTNLNNINGCTKYMLQSYIDEYVWRYNNNCTNDSRVAFDLVMKELAKIYQPGNKLFPFDITFKPDENEETFDTDFGPETEFGNLVNAMKYEEIFNNGHELDYEELNSKTNIDLSLIKNENVLVDEDIDGSNEFEDHSKNSNFDQETDKLTKNLDTMSNEIESLEQEICPNGHTDVINKPLSNTLPSENRRKKDQPKSSTSQQLENTKNKLGLDNKSKEIKKPKKKKDFFKFYQTMLKFKQELDQLTKLKESILRQENKLNQQKEYLKKHALENFKIELDDDLNVLVSDSQSSSQSNDTDDEDVTNFDETVYF